MKSETILSFLSGDGVLKVDSHYYDKSYLRTLFEEINKKALLVECGIDKYTECEKFVFFILIEAVQGCN